MNKESGELVKFDGLSGNQVMLFQALDAFLGLDEYLSPESLERNVPSRQRDFCSILRKNSFRKMVKDCRYNKSMADMTTEFRQILERLRVSPEQMPSQLFLTY